jgi:WD40-like Beta Propeller Repeat
MLKPLSFISGICCVVQSFAQMPNTDVWLFKIETDKTGAYSLKEPLNISNREGYDNQPSFSNDGKKVYYVSVREDKQADIYAYDLKTKTTVQITKSKESEYSPVMTEKGHFLNSVVVEADSAQCIHYIPIVEALAEKKIEVDSVGYYCFLNSDTVVYYKLTEPHSLRYYVNSSKEDKWLGNSPIRGFKAVNRHQLVYGLKDSLKVEFYLYDFLLHKATKYCEYPSFNEDIWWHNKWGLLKSEETKILRYDASKSNWLLLFDLSSFGIKKITRISFDSKNSCLVIVNNL